MLPLVHGLAHRPSRGAVLTRQSRDHTVPLVHSGHLLAEPGRCRIQPVEHSFHISLVVPNLFVTTESGRTTSTCAVRRMTDDLTCARAAVSWIWTTDLVPLDGSKGVDQSSSCTAAEIFAARSTSPMPRR